MPEDWPVPAGGGGRDLGLNNYSPRCVAESEWLRWREKVIGDSEVQELRCQSVGWPSTWLLR